MAIRIEKIVIIALLLSLSACDRNHRERFVQIPPRTIKVDTADGMPFIAVIKDSTKKIRFIPTIDNLAVIDRQVKKAVEDHNRGMREHLKKMKIEDPTLTLRVEDFMIDIRNYKRQYIAYINSKNEKEVWVNCFCETWDNDVWKFKIVEVRDGGNCYFNLKINLEQKAYFEFCLNGTA